MYRRLLLLHSRVSVRVLCTLKPRDRYLIYIYIYISHGIRWLWKPCRTISMCACTPWHHVVCQEKKWIPDTIEARKRIATYIIYIDCTMKDNLHSHHKGYRRGSFHAATPESVLYRQTIGTRLSDVYFLWLDKFPSSVALCCFRFESIDDVCLRWYQRVFMDALLFILVHDLGLHGHCTTHFFQDLPSFFCRFEFLSLFSRSTKRGRILSVSRPTRSIDPVIKGIAFKTTYKKMPRSDSETTKCVCLVILISPVVLSSVLSPRLACISAWSSFMSDSKATSRGSFDWRSFAMYKIPLSITRTTACAGKICIQMIRHTYTVPNRMAIWTVRTCIAGTI